MLVFRLPRPAPFLGSAAACGVPMEGEAKYLLSCSFSSISVKNDLAPDGFETVLTAWKELVGGVGDRV